MSGIDDLWLHEQLLLLALHDEKGTMQGQSFEFGAGGAVLGELLLAGRIELAQADGKKKKRVVKVTGSSSPGDPILDEVLARIRTAKRAEPLVGWVSRVAGTRRLRHRIADRLRYRGILGKKEGRVLLIFSRDLYPTVNPGPERELLERIRAAVLGDGDVAPRTALLISLAHQLGLLRPMFTRQELKARKQRLKQLASLEAVGEATRATIEGVQEVIAAQAAAVAIAAAG